MSSIGANRELRILVVNAGSTSLKLRIVERDDRVTETVDLDPPGDLLEDDLRGFLASAGSLDVIGHRVVHGGSRFAGPTLIDASNRAELDQMNDLAPLHNPPALAAIDALGHLLPNLPQVACFDTAFHRSLEPAAWSYALPTAWAQRWGIRRFGFHGLSCEWSVERAIALLGRATGSLRLVICHLGGGASVTATAGGRSVDTTMGFTPTEGLVMATRPGDVDPGAIAWVAARGVTPRELVDGLERQSGLLALSGGLTGDMRQLLQHREQGHAAAVLAIDVYVHRLRAKIAAMAAATNGVDAVAFTGGIGENASQIRAEVCDHLEWVGVSVDDDANGSVGTDDVDISRAGATVRTLVIHSREELVVAAGCRAALRSPT
jgi:acetate kinase